jgi:hypothetical protein
MVGQGRRGRPRRAVHERGTQVRGLRHAAGPLEQHDRARPYSADTIRALKDRVDGSIYVSGSGTLVRALLADGLVDELHVFLYPLAYGAGKRLFADYGPAARFALAGSRTIATERCICPTRPTPKNPSEVEPGCGIRSVPAQVTEPGAPQSVIVRGRTGVSRGSRVRRSRCRASGTSIPHEPAGTV